MTIDDGVFSMTQCELTTNAVPQDIQIKYNEFRKSCKTILPKIDPKLIQDFLFRQQDVSDIKPKYSLELITREGLDTQKMKDLIWNKFGKLPVIDYNGTYYRIEHTLTLEMLKRLCDYDFIVGIKGSYVGPI
jgi:hypothetical protein